jgi:hypothetical protein
MASADVDGRAVFEPEITRLSELRLSALEARIDADLAVGRHRELVGELEALTAEHPLREQLRAQQMPALYRSGGQTETLRAFERNRVYLGEEIGIDPSPALRTLEHQILDHDSALDLPALPSVTQRAVVAVEVATSGGLTHVGPSARRSLVEAVARAVAPAVTRHGGQGFAQRGAAFYAAFDGIGEAVAAVDEIAAADGGVEPKVALDFGDVAGPPVRRSAGMVAATHPGQVLLSAEAHQALTVDWVPAGRRGHWEHTRSTGSKRRSRSSSSSSAAGGPTFLRCCSTRCRRRSRWTVAPWPAMSCGGRSRAIWQGPRTGPTSRPWVARSS